MNRTGIEWTDLSSNPLKYRDATGKVVWACVHASPGCNNCYSEQIATRFDRGGPFNVPAMNRLTAPWLKRNVMPESVRDRPTTAVEYLFLLTKQESYYYDEIAVRKIGAVPSGTRAAKGSATRAEVEGVSGRPPEYWEYTGHRNRRNSDWFFESWQGLIGDEAGHPLAFVVNTRPYTGAHFATFPPALIGPCIRASSRPGDLVFDPFIGSGTTGEVAERLMRRWVGTDLNYQHLAKKRTAQRGLRLESEASA